jgi:hypothetical protein
MPQTAQLFTERLSERTIPVRDRLKVKGGWGVPTLPLDPQHPQHAGKYETKLRFYPQQSRNKRATGGATFSKSQRKI